MMQADSNNMFTLGKAGKEDVPLVMDFINKQNFSTFLGKLERALH